jgi:hypothetical protein
MWGKPICGVLASRIDQKKSWIAIATIETVVDYTGIVSVVNISVNRRCKAHRRT